MKVKMNPSRILVIFAFVLLSITMNLSSPAAVGAQTEEPPPDLINELTDQQKVVPMSVSASVPGGPGFVTLGSMDFQPAKSSDQYVSTPGRFYNSGSDSEVYIGIVHLPQGVVVNQVVVYYENNSAVSIGTLYLRFGLLDSSVHIYVSRSIPPIGTAYQSMAIPITTDPVDNSQYQYQFWVTLPASSQANISGVRLDYGYPALLPIITK